MRQKKTLDISEETIQSAIYSVRGHRVMLDRDLARLYGVPTKALLQAVRRNADRFPSDFMFPLSRQEVENLRSQIVTSSWGGRRYLPYVFTEQGVAMLSSVLKSKSAIQVNITVMRVFVKLKGILSARKELALKLERLEQKFEKHDEEIQAIFAAIRRLMSPPPVKPKRPIGFHV